MSYPVMYPEVIEAVKEKWKDDDGILTDCFIYLKNISDNPHMRHDIENELASMCRCIKCGTKLEYYQWKELHTEISPIEYETMSDWYCPVCDGGNDE